VTVLICVADNEGIAGQLVLLGAESLEQAAYSVAEVVGGCTGRSRCDLDTGQPTG
jgi:hypothetical protein